MKPNQLLHAIYTKLWEQRAVLTEFPPLTIDITQTTPETMNYNQAKDETGHIVSHLLAVKNVQETPLKDALKTATTVYQNQAFWKGIILDYLTFLNAETTEQIKQQGEEARQQVVEALNQINTYEEQQTHIVKTYAESVKKAGFPVNAEQMIRNYLKMHQQDANKAWQTLITNPAYFSPIITTDENGNTTLTPQQATDYNKKLGVFLKKLSV